MKNRIYLSAFTIMELTVAMLISAICLGIAFFVLNSFYKFGMVQQKERSEDLSIRHFYHLMNKEIINAEGAFFLENSIVLKRKDYVSEYIIMDSLIVRKQNETVTDTIHCQIQDIQVHFMENINDTLFKSISLILGTKNGSVPFVFSKTYSAEQLINITQ